jgi:hypothetical protein
MRDYPDLGPAAVPPNLPIPPQADPAANQRMPLRPIHPLRIDGELPPV